MDVNIEMLILCIESSEMNEKEKRFLINNIKNIEKQFKIKFNNEISIKI